MPLQYQSLTFTIFLEACKNIVNPDEAFNLQVNSLRQELQLLARDRTITIVNASGSGSGYLPSFIH